MSCSRGFKREKINACGYLGKEETKEEEKKVLYIIIIIVMGIVGGLE